MKLHVPLCLYAFCFTYNTIKTMKKFVTLPALRSISEIVTDILSLSRHYFSSGQFTLLFLIYVANAMVRPTNILDT